MLDVSLFGASIPAGTYTRGDTVTLGLIDGPSVVRSGRGAAILKRITSGLLIGAATSAAKSFWEVSVRNSDWIDDATSLTTPLDEPNALDKYCGNIQDGQNCPLTPNSSWQVVATCKASATTTVANSIFCCIEVDYPQVSSIEDPTRLTGVPTSIEETMTINLAAPNITAGTWTTVNVDFFKAGYEYALVKPELTTPGNGATGFIKLANAAGMGGLSRIIPISSPVSNVRNIIEYASKLVKGPMDISAMLFSITGTAVSGATADIILDFVKRRI